MWSRRLKEATGRLVVAWVLASACLTGHLAHLWKGAPAWLHLFGRPSVHAAMSALALLGQHSHPAFTSAFALAPCLSYLPSTCFAFALLCLCPAFPFFAFARTSAFAPLCDTLVWCCAKAAMANLHRMKIFVSMPVLPAALFLSA